MDKKDYIHNHYVPQWYQYRFFQGNEEENKFYYLDLKPEKIKANDGREYTRNARRRVGPKGCYYEDSLYTKRYYNFESAEIEKYFFGQIDDNGKRAIDFFIDFKHPNADSESLKSLLSYMSVQKLRTPKGLAYLSLLLKNPSKNILLEKMRELHKMHSAIWAECVWCIVDAIESETKFICSDHPITVYNKDCSPDSKWCQGDNDPEIWLNGTHTIFPLSINKVLLLGYPQNFLER